MRKIIILFFLIVSSTYSQSDFWWVFFQDKDCGQSIAISQRSIDRRIQKNIPLDWYDFSVCQEYIDSLKHHDLLIRHQSRWLNAVSVSVESFSLLETILDYSFVKEIRPVSKMINDGYKITQQNNIDFPNAQMRNSLLSYGSSFNQIDMLGGIELHNQGFLGEGMTIAVFDAGFIGLETLPIFENLWDNNQISHTYDFVDNNPNVFNGSFHGTMVLSTMGGYMSDSLIGTAPAANYMLFRTEDSASETLIEEDNWAAAAEYADSLGVDIINSSLGYTVLYDDTLNSHSYSDMDGNSTIITNAADLAASRGILVINSAGNSGNNDWYYIGAPADGDSVLAVGSVNSVGEVSSFSSRGPSYDGRIKPNICAQGSMSVVADQDSTIRLASGTSFSSPIVAGLAACLWQALSTQIMNINNMHIFEIIQESAHLFLNPNDSLGYGIPDFYSAYLNNLHTSVLFNDIKIYPNPYIHSLYLENNSQKDVCVEIFNIIGDVIFSQHTILAKSKISISELANLKAGLYFLKICNEQSIYPIVKLNGN